MANGLLQLVDWGPSGPYRSSLPSPYKELEEGIVNGKPKEVQAAIDNGADINAKIVSRNGNSSIAWRVMYTHRYEKTEIMVILLENGLKITEELGYKLWVWSWEIPQAPYIDVMKALIKRGIKHDPANHPPFWLLEKDIQAEILECIEEYERKRRL